MELNNSTLELQKRIDNLIPSPIKTAMEIQKKFSSSFTAVDKNFEYIDIQNSPLYKLITSTGKNFEFIDIQSSPLYKSITNAFSLIDHFEIDTAISFTTNYDNLLFANFNFEDLPERKEEDKKIVVSDARQIKRIITDIYKDNIKLLSIEPREFERLVAELLHSQGFDVELTKQTRDNGYDIIAIKKIDSFVPLKFLVECKRYKTEKIGVEIIRSFKNVIDEQNANRGLIVTTSYFTKDAIKQRKQYPYLLEYKDKDRVLEWINEYSLQRLHL